MSQTINMNDSQDVNQKFSRQANDNDNNDIFGYLIALIFDPPEQGFASYEVYNFIEETLKVELEDLSVFRNAQGNPLGVVVAQMTDECSLSRLSRIAGREFKGSAVSVRLFTSQTSFQKFIFAQSHSRLQNIILNYDESVPLVYVNNFPNYSDDKIGEFFSKCGAITSFKKVPLKDRFYFIIQYSTTEEARKAYHMFSDYRINGDILKTALLYKSAAERTFAVHHCQDKKWLEAEVTNFGQIDEIKVGQDGIIYIMMMSIESSKAACLLLNKEFNNGIQITTNFVDYEYFKRAV
ncbi:hypothetical protein M9Y10_038456 [Tritrichomonas musculus]|uniref:RRM domain-containing protein n=1 Tax=Tritrichomonas musculus TaxID=1915356 RepID=A0ABR2K957_9EUKA